MARARHRRARRLSLGLTALIGLLMLGLPAATGAAPLASTGPSGATAPVLPSGPTAPASPTGPTGTSPARTVAGCVPGPVPTTTTFPAGPTGVSASGSAGPSGTIKTGGPTGASGPSGAPTTIGATGATGPSLHLPLATGISGATGLGTVQPGDGTKWRRSDAAQPASLGRPVHPGRPGHEQACRTDGPGHGSAKTQSRLLPRRIQQGGVATSAAAVVLRFAREGELEACPRRSSAAALTPDDAGYWLVTAKGKRLQIRRSREFLRFARAPKHCAPRSSSMAPTPDGFGYWLVDQKGDVFNYGDAPACGAPVGVGPALIMRSPRAPMVTATGWRAERCGLQLRRRRVLPDRRCTLRTGRCSRPLPPRPTVSATG